MEEKNYRLSAAVCSMPADDVDKLISAADGDAALLYLYLLRQGKGRDEAEISRQLGMALPRLRDAAGRLRSLGLLSGGTRRQPTDELPQYDAKDVIRRSGEDPAFRGILAEAESILGRALGAADTKTIFGIYDYLGLPSDVILLLLHHCGEECRRRYGPGRVPTVRQIEKEAYIWANREIMTFELAEEYIRQCALSRETVESLRRSFGIRDRDLTPTERKYIDGWLNMGFPAESIELAFDRTVTNIGQLKWNYMNKIVTSWHDKGLHTPEEIEKGDGPSRRASTRPSATAPETPTNDEIERMKRLYDKVKNGRGDK